MRCDGVTTEVNNHFIAPLDIILMLRTLLLRPTSVRARFAAFRSVVPAFPIRTRTMASINDVKTQAVLDASELPEGKM
jgi:hypothetical protein